MERLPESTGGPTAFVFAGGGSLGAVEVGMLRALVEVGQSPDLVLGASVGTINGLYFAAAPDARGVERLAQVWLASGGLEAPGIPVALEPHIHK